MKKIFSLFLILGLVFFFCQSIEAKSLIKEKVIKKIEDHSVTITVTYLMSQNRYNQKIRELEKWRQHKLAKVPHIVFVKNTVMKDEKVVKLVIYLGSGTVLPEDYIFTVNHLFDTGSGIYGRDIKVYHRNIDHPILADLIAISKGKEWADDYAMIRMKESLGLPGIKLEYKEAKKGDIVIWDGNPAGIAWYQKHGFLTFFHKFFGFDERTGQFELIQFEDFPYYCVNFGMPGCSGSGLFNSNGKLLSINYCGMELYSETFLFSNPTRMMWEFLRAHQLQHLMD